MPDTTLEDGALPAPCRGLPQRTDRLVLPAGLDSINPDVGRSTPSCTAFLRLADINPLNRVALFNSSTHQLINSSTHL